MDKEEELMEVLNELKKSEEEVKQKNNIKSQNLENENHNKIILIGTLLIMPIYMFILPIYKWISGEVLSGGVAFMVMCLPTTIGVILYLPLFKKYKNGKSEAILAGTILFNILIYYNFYNTYYVEHPGWDNLGYGFMSLLSAVVYRVLAYCLYGTLVGWKKTLSFFVVYIIIILLSVQLGFWI